MNLNRRTALKAAAGAAALSALSMGRANAEDPPADGGVELVGGWQTNKAGNKHIPVVQVERDGDHAHITIEVKHPQNGEHHISYIRIYNKDRVEVTSVELNPVHSATKATVSLKAPAGTEFYAVSDCNLHGLWMKSFSV